MSFEVGFCDGLAFVVGCEIHFCNGLLVISIFNVCVTVHLHLPPRPTGMRVKGPTVYLGPQYTGAHNILGPDSGRQRHNKYIHFMNVSAI